MTEKLDKKDENVIDTIALEHRIAMVSELLSNNRDVINISQVEDLIPNSLIADNFDKQEYVLDEAINSAVILKKIAKSDTDKKIVAKFLTAILDAERNLSEMKTRHIKPKKLILEKSNDDR